MGSTAPRSYPSYLEHDQQRQVADQYVSPAINQSGITSADKYYNWLRDRDFKPFGGWTRPLMKQFDDNNPRYDLDSYIPVAF